LQACAERRKTIPIEAVEELHHTILSWIEHTYNSRYRQRALGRLAPLELQLAFAGRGTVAA